MRKTFSNSSGEKSDSPSPRMGEKGSDSGEDDEDKELLVTVVLGMPVHNMFLVIQSRLSFGLGHATFLTGGSGGDLGLVLAPSPPAATSGHVRLVRFTLISLSMFAHSAKKVIINTKETHSSVVNAVVTPRQSVTLCFISFFKLFSVLSLFSKGKGR